MDRNRKQTPKGKTNSPADRKRPSSDRNTKTDRPRSGASAGRPRKSFDKSKDSKSEFDKPRKPRTSFDKKEKTTKTVAKEEGDRLNKYLANAGVCSRREADKLIESGVVQINGVVITQLGTRVKRTDKVQFGGQTLSREKPVYLLLNKPKGFITTSDDPQNRRTVMNLVENACPERIYPVGRLDRNTTGLLLFTNDGDLAKKLMHPKYEIKKIYQVTLDKNLTKNDLLRIAGGVELEDGVVAPDKIAYVAQSDDKKEIGIEIHSGRNRIVRRIFEHVGYQVIKLDRVFLAGLTKKDLPRGKWKFLSLQEINMLKRLG